MVTAELRTSIRFIQYYFLQAILTVGFLFSTIEMQAHGCKKPGIKIIERYYGSKAMLKVKNEETFENVVIGSGVTVGG